MSALPTLFAWLLLLPSLTPDLDGAWQLVMQAPQGVMDAPLRIETRDGIVHVEIVADIVLPMEDVELTDEYLQFAMPLSHGRVDCTLFINTDEPDRLTGLCTGPIGESAAVATRV